MGRKAKVVVAQAPKGEKLFARFMAQFGKVKTVEIERVSRGDPAKNEKLDVELVGGGGKITDLPFEPKLEAERGEVQRAMPYWFREVVELPVEATKDEAEEDDVADDGDDPSSSG